VLMHYRFNTHLVPMIFFFFYCYGDHRDLHSFPTRRSSDLSRTEAMRSIHEVGLDDAQRPVLGQVHINTGAALKSKTIVGRLHVRSEEHTSELQSRGHLVCRLLLEKKND